jgi:hypothetical protein
MDILWYKLTAEIIEISWSLQFKLIVCVSNLNWDIEFSLVNDCKYKWIVLDSYSWNWEFMLVIAEVDILG